MDDNIWEYPFGELEEDEDIFFYGPFDMSYALPVDALYAYTM